MFFDNVDALARTLIVGTLAYLAMVCFLRVSGKRTLSKWNAFDLVVTVALGSTLATALLSERTSLAQGALAFAVLILLQFVFTWAAVRWKRFERIIKARPTMLLYRGRFRADALRQQRVTESEVRAALREKGIARLEEVGAVILETDGSFSVIRELSGSVDSTLADVEGSRGEER